MSIIYLKKSHPTMEPDSDDIQSCRQVRYTLPMTNSAKNLHELQKINFTQPKVTNSIDKIVHQQKINRLEKEKAQLIESLQILKNGALSAILEKDQIIEALRKLFNEANGRECQTFAQQFEILLQRIKQLQDERNQLRKESEKKRQIYEQQIQERQAVIQNLTSELNWSIERIYSLEQYDKLLEEKIKIIEVDNSHLNLLITQSNQSQLSSKDQGYQNQKSHSENKLLKNKSTQSIIHGGGSDSQNETASRFRRFLHETQQSNASHHNLEQSLFNTRIQHLNAQHQRELQYLTDFYESRIQSLKKLCKQLPQLPKDTTQPNNKLKKYNACLNDDQNINTLNLNHLHDQPQQQTKTLKKNLSFGSIREIRGFIRMDSIDQRDQLKKQACSLKKQIIMNAEKQLMRVSSSVSIESKSSQNNENESQFSYKHFDYSCNFKKNKGQIVRVDSIISNTQEITLRKCQKCEKREIEKQQTKQVEKKQTNERGKREKKSQIWDRLLWFIFGTLAGGLFLYLGHLIFR